MLNFLTPSTLFPHVDKPAKTLASVGTSHVLAPEHSAALCPGPCDPHWFQEHCAALQKQGANARFGCALPTWRREITAFARTSVVEVFLTL